MFSISSLWPSNRSPVDYHFRLIFCVHNHIAFTQLADQEAERTAVAGTDAEGEDIDIIARTSIVPGRRQQTHSSESGRSGGGGGLQGGRYGGGGRSLSRGDRHGRGEAENRGGGGEMGLREFLVDSEAAERRRGVFQRGGAAAAGGRGIRAPLPTNKYTKPFSGGQEDIANKYV